MNDLMLVCRYELSNFMGVADRRADRITSQKAAIHVLVVLYANSTNHPERSDTLHDDTPEKKANRHLFKSAIKGIRNVATTTTTALGNVASEIAGTCVRSLVGSLLRLQTPSIGLSSNPTHRRRWSKAPLGRRTSPVWFVALHIAHWRNLTRSSLARAAPVLLLPKVRKPCAAPRRPRSLLLLAGRSTGRICALR